MLRAYAIAVAWFAVLTALNLAFDGKINYILFFALPVAIAAWHCLGAGFFFAGVGLFSAAISGVIPLSDASEPLWIECMWPFLKLSAVALGVRLGLSLWNWSTTK
jgi:uncharacterized membrane protein